MAVLFKLQCIHCSLIAYCCTNPEGQGLFLFLLCFFFIEPFICFFIRASPWAHYSQTFVSLHFHADDKQMYLPIRSTDPEMLSSLMIFSPSLSLSSRTWPNKVCHLLVPYWIISSLLQGLSVWFDSNLSFEPCSHVFIILEYILRFYF